MNRLIAYFDSAVQGIGRYFEVNKLIVLVFALLLAWWLADKKPENTKGKNLLLYTLVMSLLLLIPVTAVFVMMYQTAFYDYEWAWSMVPVTAVLAYGAVCLLKKNLKKGKLLWGILGVAAILCLCGNQGTLMTVSGKEAMARENTAEILQELSALDVEKPCILWAPKNIMEQVRRRDGKILLIYGRDMWDVKAGAYDYEAYSAELTNAYVWLEVMTEQAEVASIMADQAASFSTLCVEKDLNRFREEYLGTVLENGGNVLVFPNLVAEHIEESILKLAREKELLVKNAYTEEYTIYLLK